MLCEERAALARLVARIDRHVCVPVCVARAAVLQLDQHYYDRTSLECPVVTFAQPRQDAGQLSAIYAGAAQPEVRAGVWCVERQITAVIQCLVQQL